MPRGNPARMLGRGDRRVQIEETITTDSENEGESGLDTQGRPASSGRSQGGLSELFHRQRASVDSNPPNSINHSEGGQQSHSINAAATAPRNSPSPDLPPPSRRRSQSDARYHHRVVPELTGCTRSRGFTQDNSPPQYLLEGDVSPPLSLLVGSRQPSPESSPRTWQCFFVNLFAGRRGRRRRHTSSRTAPTSSTRNPQQNPPTGPTSSARHSGGEPINVPSHPTNRRAYDALPSFDVARPPTLLRTHFSADTQPERPLLPHTVHPVVHPLPVRDVQEILRMRNSDCRPHPHGGMAVVQPASPQAAGQTVTVGFDVPQEPAIPHTESSQRMEEEGEEQGADWEVGSDEQRQFTDHHRAMNVLDRGMSPWWVFEEMESGRKSMFETRSDRRRE